MKTKSHQTALASKLNNFFVFSENTTKLKMQLTLARKDEFEAQSEAVGTLTGNLRDKDVNINHNVIQNPKSGLYKGEKRTWGLMV